MRKLVVTTATLLSWSLVPGHAEESGLSKTYMQPQSVPVQPGRTPQQSNQERARGENVQVERNWKAREDAGQTAPDRAESPGKTDEDHQTVGRDWRSHPEGDDNR